MRPFLRRAGIKPRHCSLPLQRRIVDFGTDLPFQRVPKKLKEHYGIELSTEVARQTTLKHASRMESLFDKRVGEAKKREVKQIIAEADGGMVPIVTFKDLPEVTDRRKAREVEWREAKLCLSREVGSDVAYYLATMKSPKELGEKWLLSAEAAGLGEGTKVHCVGDGAPWIQDQSDRAFGSQGSYLVDFFHVSDYLSKVAKESMQEGEGILWFREQQERLKKGDLYLVLQQLEKLIYDEGAKRPEAEVCYRYLTNRLGQLDYLGAIEKGLPIGSGEIESGHRHVVQKRMKRAGSWWKEENAEAMLQLLTAASSNFLESYWIMDKQGFNEEAA